MVDNESYPDHCAINQLAIKRGLPGCHEECKPTVSLDCSQIVPLWGESKLTFPPVDPSYSPPRREPPRLSYFEKAGFEAVILPPSESETESA